MSEAIDAIAYERSKVDVNIWYRYKAIFLKHWVDDVGTSDGNHQESTKEEDREESYC